MPSRSNSDEPAPPARTRRERYRERVDFDSNASWKDWLRQRYAKTWYLVGCLFLDGMLVTAALSPADLSQPWPYLEAAGILAGLGVLEFLGLRHFWPPKPAS